MTSLEDSIEQASVQAGYAPLKDSQRTCITEFMKGKDVFVLLPTGYGKTPCYACLPAAFDIHQQRTKEELSIIVVITPLTALMEDQVSNLVQRQILAGFVDANSSFHNK
jgi:superfamily II DNA helicase RecQ